jgi:hypothetical protein
MNSTIMTLYKYLLKYGWKAEIVSQAQNTYLIRMTLTSGSGHRESVQVVLTPTV